MIFLESDESDSYVMMQKENKHVSIRKKRYSGIYPIDLRNGGDDNIQIDENMQTKELYRQKEIAIDMICNCKTTNELTHHLDSYFPKSKKSKLWTKEKKEQKIT